MAPKLAAALDGVGFRAPGLGGRLAGAFGSFKLGEREEQERQRKAKLEAMAAQLERRRVEQGDKQIDLQREGLDLQRQESADRAKREGAGLKLDLRRDTREQTAFDIGQQRETELQASRGDLMRGIQLLDPSLPTEALDNLSVDDLRTKSHELEELRRTREREAAETNRQNNSLYMQRLSEARALDMRARDTIGLAQRTEESLREGLIEVTRDGVTSMVIGAQATPEERRQHVVRSLGYDPYSQYRQDRDQANALRGGQPISPVDDPAETTPWLQHTAEERQTTLRIITSRVQSGAMTPDQVRSEAIGNWGYPPALVEQAIAAGGTSIPGSVINPMAQAEPINPALPSNFSPVPAAATPSPSLLPPMNAAAASMVRSPARPFSAPGTNPASLDSTLQAHLGRLATGMTPEQSLLMISDPTLRAAVSDRTPKRP